MNYKDRTALELLKSYDAILEELRGRNIIRNANPPAGGYAEHLASQTLNLTLETNSNTGYDAKDEQGKRYEIKARRITRHNKSRQLSAIRNIENKHFDFLIGVLFNSDFSIFKAALIPHEIVLQQSRFSAHTNASLLLLRDSLWDIPQVENLTNSFKQTEKKI
ncbi:MAG: hypothetical protein CL570_00350 [Alphaproteobacteria bacterium]|nr:hypothetical protein [Alphaproteobacteria bacterium]|tara:strand:- start:7968 stop:8456 length:489 start_codon:yes stop_codon:yes gene_type:complete